MRAPKILPLALGCALASTLAAQGPAPTVLPAAAAHGNVTPAGALSAGVLSLALTAQRVRWHPEAEDGPSVEVDAFGVEGSRPSIPGPLIRVPSGTRVETSIRNTLADTLLVFGLSGAGGDTVRIAPGAMGSARFTADAPGTYGYGGATIVEDSVRLLGTGNQLLGALIVDGPDPRPDRIFVLSIWTAGTGRFAMAINGRSWPHTERMDVSVGEPVHWRIVNGTRGRHPMHLHGFFFRVDSRGSWSADTAMTGERPTVVTESVPYRGTFTMTWTADRPGNWLFHCHDALHTSWRRRYNLIGERPPQTLPMHDAAHHVEQDMSGLVLGIRARGAEPAVKSGGAPRRIRLVATAKPGVYGREPGLSFVTAEARESVPTLVLTRNEPAEITVVNRLGMATGVHWHGIELDSYYDGVAGWSGGDAGVAPLIMPEDSFVVRMTPPRAGTFIYHAHVDDVRQIALGLYGALIVLPPGERRDPATDHIVLLSQLGRGRGTLLGLNGTATPAPLTLTAGVRHRLRFINISVADDAEFTLRSDTPSDTSIVTWRAIAKDGADLPRERAIEGPARVFITPGETYDFEAALPAGEYRLQMKSTNDVEIPVRVPRATRAEVNDNRIGAGVLKDGVLKIHLVAQLAAWYPEAEDGPVKVVEAFGELGLAPRIPGPLIRVPLGTTVEATITNSLADTLIVLGLRGRNDSLRIAPDRTQRVRHTPQAIGTYLYAAGDIRSGKVRFGGTSGQLVGGLIVDPGRAPRDRILIATGWDPVPIAGNPHFLAMNGKSWPYTEKLAHAVGDTVRWRVLNAGAGLGAHHPMHLHGFYYRVDARGGWDADTLYQPGQERWVVTENLPALGSMAMTWVPARAGNWLFHCHNADHVAGRNRHFVAGTARPFPEAPTHDAQEHMAWDMSGLVNAITILPRPGDPVAKEPVAAGARTLRLLIQQRPRYYGRGPGFGYVLQEGAAEPAADSIGIPGPELVLRRGEPVEITLVNRLSIHTAVHWHGIELESFYDGVAGWSGAGGRLAPMIAPQDSFIVRFTPPRAGTFIYHAHITDHLQVGRGLYGALLVVDEPRVEAADHVAIIGFGRPGGKAGILVNGSLAPAPIERRREGMQRLRLINITTENSAIVTLSDAGAPVVWRAVAKDGFDLPAGQRRAGNAEMSIFPGETYDFEFESAADVLQLRIRNPNLPDGDEGVSLQLEVKP